jgi:hypothetical protein
MEFDLMDDSIVLLIALQWLFGYQIPYMDNFIIAGDEVAGSW